MTEQFDIPHGALTPDEWIARVEASVAWLSSRVRVSAGSRFHRYLSELRLEREGKPNDDDIVAQALVETHELGRIHEAFAERAEPSFIEKLAFIAAGPALPFGETGAGHARNYQFELFTAAELQLKGLPVLFEEPDIVINACAKFVGVAAKRPRNFDQIRRQLSRAVSQLLLNQDRITHGVIALDTSIVITDRPGALFFEVPPPGSVIAPYVERLANALIARKRLEPVLRQHDFRLTCGIWLYAHVPYVTGAGGFHVSGNYRMLFPDLTHDDTINLLQNGLREVR